MTGALAKTSTNYKWIVVGALWFVCLFNYADRQAIFSVFPLLKSELHLTDVQLGIVGASFMWVYALVGPFAGWLCDRVERKALIIGAFLFWSVITATSALSHTYAELILCRALSGLGEAVYLPASMSLISDYHGSATRSRAMSFHQSGVYVGTIMGGGLSAWIAQHFGWRVSFILFGGLGVVLGLILLKLLHEPERGKSERHIISQDYEGAPRLGLWYAIREVVSTRAVLLLILVFIGANFVAVVFLSWMPSFLYRKFNMSLSLAGFNGTAYLQAASIFGVLFGGFLADKLTNRNQHLGNARMLTQSIGLFCGVPFLFLIGYTRSLPMLFTSLLVLGYCKGIYDSNIFASLYDLVSVKRRGVAAGLMNSLGWLGGGTAPVLIAIVALHYGMSACISGTAAIYILAGIILIFTARRVAV